MTREEREKAIDLLDNLVLIMTYRVRILIV